MTGVLDTLPEEKTEISGKEDGSESANSFLVRQAQAYIAEHYACRLSLQEVADHCYVKPVVSVQAAAQASRDSFYDLLNSVRVQKAKELLENPALRISEIAEQVGYADTAHFSRVFKKSEGIPAGDWRNINCGRNEKQ